MGRAPVIVVCSRCKTVLGEKAPFHVRTPTHTYCRLCGTVEYVLMRYWDRRGIPFRFCLSMAKADAAVDFGAYK